MQQLEPSDYPQLEEMLGPDRCCSLHARHVIQTGHGQIFVDRWPDHTVGAAFTGGNMGLFGEPARFSPAALRSVLERLLEHWDRIFIDPGEELGPVLEADCPGLWLWPRVLYALPGEAHAPPTTSDGEVRAIGPEDVDALAGLDADIAWIADTHDGPIGLAASGRAVGAWREGRLAAVAASFYVGHEYEELGVVTGADHRGRGLSTVCSAALIRAIHARGHRACWSTTPDNLASQRVAEKLGFRRIDEQRHYMFGAAVTGALRLGATP